MTEYEIGAFRDNITEFEELTKKAKFFSYIVFIVPAITVALGLVSVNHDVPTFGTTCFVFAVALLIVACWVRWETSCNLIPDLQETKNLYQQILDSVDLPKDQFLKIEKECYEKIKSRVL